MAVDFDTTHRWLFKIKAKRAIKRLVGSEMYAKPLESPSCDRGDPKGLVSQTFKYKGKGRSIVLTVTCHAKVMVGLLRAMLVEPTIQVTASSDSAYSGSYRTWDQQYWLWDQYVHHGGHKAAHPCSGYHRQGRALDLLDATDKEADAMADVRVSGLRFYNGAGFGDPPHWTLGAYG